MTLHNQALMNMDPRPSEGFEKLSFLVQQPAFPPVCFGNLLLLYCKHEVRLQSLYGEVGLWVVCSPLAPDNVQKLFQTICS